MERAASLWKVRFKSDGWTRLQPQLGVTRRQGFFSLFFTPFGPAY
jgi:hypothetical protein